MSMIWIGVAGFALEAGSTIYGAQQQKKASDQAATTDTAISAYNSKYDLAEAAQIDYNTQENIRTERQDESVYLSRQEASYAAAGVLTTSGSPLHAMITTAGRFEQKIQQDYVDSQQKQQSYQAAAAVGLLEGSAQAQADRLGGTIALINAGAQVTSSFGSAYNKGVFSGGGGTITGEPSGDLF